jgi:thiopurine S-methyltransferase
MDAPFWFESWEMGGTKTSFHRPGIHPFVVKHAPPEQLRDKRVLVPLCGKTDDLLWYGQHAREVFGIELVPTAIELFFAENQLPYDVNGARYSAGNINILAADVFDVTTAETGPIDVIYDRAALVALPEPMRRRYVEKIHELSPAGSVQLLNTIEYSPQRDEPPFSVSPDEVNDYYGSDYEISHVEAVDRPDHRMKEKFGLEFFTEHAFSLVRRPH